MDSETRKPLVEMILDKAGAKGTGKWTNQVALDMGVAIPTIAAAVDARNISALKEQRVAASKQLAGPRPAQHSRVHAQREVTSTQDFISDVRNALYCSKICSY